MISTMIGTGPEFLTVRIRRRHSSRSRDLPLRNHPSSGWGTGLRTALDESRRQFFDELINSVQDERRQDEPRTANRYHQPLIVFASILVGVNICSPVMTP